MSAELLIRLPDYFPSLINAMQDGFVLRGTDGTIIEVNHAFCEMVGLERSEIVGSRPPHVWWPEETHGQFEDALKRYLSGVSTEDDLLYQRRNGEQFPALITNAPLRDSEERIIAYIGTVKDISERKRQEEEQAFLSNATRVLASSLDYRETLTSVAHLAVPTIADWCVVHAVGDDGQIGQIAVAHANPAKVVWAREIQERYPSDPNAPTGVPNVIRTGQPEVYSHISDELLVAAARDEEHLALIREVGFTSAMVLPIVAREKVLGVITLVSAELGRHYGDSSLALAQHLAHRSAVAIDNAMLYQEAQEAARARDQFLAVAAHELRSPLTSMKGFAQLLLRRAKRMPGGSEWITPLQTIDAQVNRVTELVSRLLDVSRIEEKRLQLQIEPVNIVEVVRGAAVEAQLATEQHSVAARFAEESLIASIDRTRIEQVLANLLDNAIRYSPAGTSVEIVLRSDGDDLIIAVSDEGPGIPADAQKQMFERYFRGTSSSRTASEGLGLGLYVAHGIVGAHGGRMWVESEDGHGTTFSFSLPRSPHPVARAVQPDHEAVGG